MRERLPAVHLVLTQHRWTSGRQLSLGAVRLVLGAWGFVMVLGCWGGRGRGFEVGTFFDLLQWLVQTVIPCFNIFTNARVDVSQEEALLGRIVGSVCGRLFSPRYLSQPNLVERDTNRKTLPRLTQARISLLGVCLILQ